MEITQIERDNAIILALSGRLDAYTASTLRHSLNDALENGHTALVIDLSGVTFVDSSGLAVLVSGMKHARQAAGDLHLACLQEQVSIIFQLTRLDQAFAISPDVDQALTALGTRD